MNVIATFTRAMERPLLPLLSSATPSDLLLITIWFQNTRILKERQNYEDGLGQTQSGTTERPQYNTT